MPLDPLDSKDIFKPTNILCLSDYLAKHCTWAH